MNERTAVTLPLLPLPGGVVVPQMVVNLVLDTDEARAAVAAASRSGNRLLLVPHLGERYAAVGTIATVEQAGDLPDGRRAALVRGLARAQIGAGEMRDGATLWVAAEQVDDVPVTGGDVDRLAREYRAVLAEILAHRRAERVAEAIEEIEDPGALADTAVYSPDLSIERKVEVLETLDVAERLTKVLGWARETLAEISLREKVRADAGDRLDRAQRQAILRQQLDAIRAELGEGDDDIVARYRTRVAESAMPDGARQAAEREIDRLERMGEANPEHGWVRTWLDTLLDLPWGRRSEDRLDLAAARAVLDADHTGLDDVKERVVEYLAVRKLRRERGLEDAPASEPGRDATPADGERDEVPGGDDRPGDPPPVAGGSRRGSGAILALVGPPGVGKTSLGESVARALGRPFVRVALGGIRDEAEIRGHRRTYVGAQPGRIARALREAGTMNPVFLLDEVDKVAADWRGDPTAALLEVLDPAQNHTFRDHYLEVDLDLSQVLFLATANVVETIPAPLLDRLEVIRLDGYTDDEKAAIARDHLLPRQLEGAGLRADELTVTDDAIAAVIDGYTREAGVRGLERALGKIARKAATQVAAGGAHAPIVVDPDDLREFLGRPTVHHEVADRAGVPGVATGLAVTGAGGDVLFVEASTGEGEPGLTLTGQLGEVMRESAEIALSYVRAHADELGVPPQALQRKRIHIHVPAGAIPKDGPSAGVTMTAALASRLTGRPLRDRVGMTGEVTLAGRVLPIGGVKQKVLAADRAGLREVILPARNADDLEDVPAAVRDRLTFHLAEEVGDVLAAALPGAAAAAAA